MFRTRRKTLENTGFGKPVVKDGEYLAIVTDIRGPTEAKSGKWYVYCDLKAIGQGNQLYDYDEEMPSILFLWDPNMEDFAIGRSEGLGAARWNRFLDAMDIQPPADGEEDSGVDPSAFINGPIVVYVETYSTMSDGTPRKAVSDNYVRPNQQQLNLALEYTQRRKL